MNIKLNLSSSDIFDHESKSVMMIIIVMLMSLLFIHAFINSSHKKELLAFIGDQVTTSIFNTPALSSLFHLISLIVIVIVIVILAISLKGNNWDSLIE